MNVPPQEHVYEYTAGRYPYVIVEERGQAPLHARVKAWAGDQIQIEYPPLTAAGTFDGEPELRWVHKDLAKQVRRADARWAHTDDEMQWHMDRDKTIDYRPGVKRD
ncbi:hypothetical protein NMP99_03150 [Glutamicibacter mishrai]|uniref:hypothetical protein n=1 Tax=Glutamicibacter mishrai TaxID=1775880 RepID=UPI0020CD3CA4|nr:hypothetical protein [Glutamicibacter mishrai]UTT40268.1 hypothetical protein NMP99_02860 [Glutamicibacter mishrai]UTT40319.1 hypothetical protein NMP99_03150 [Glutamicibacter mishrai]